MAIEFKETIVVKPKGDAELVAERVSVLLDKHFPAAPFDGKVAQWSTEWRLLSETNTRSIGASPREVFEEFREHDIEPDTLMQSRRVRSGGSDEERAVSVKVYYAIKQKELHFDLSGTSRMVVDGAAAACRRIKLMLENGEPIQVQGTPSVPETAISTGVNPAESSEEASSWVSRTWKDHTAQFVVAVVSGVLVVMIALWLGLSPNP